MKKKAQSPQLRSEQHEAAIEEYEKGIRLFQQKDHAKAIPRFEAILAEHPNEAALCDRARVYLRIARGEVAARRPLRETRDPAAAYDVGVYLLNDGEYKEAARHLERATEHQPADAGAHVALGSARLHAGDVEGCLRALRRAVELDAGMAHRICAMSDFDDLDGHPEFEAIIAEP